MKNILVQCSSPDRWKILPHDQYIPVPRGCVRGLLHRVSGRDAQTFSKKLKNKQKDQKEWTEKKTWIQTKNKWKQFFSKNDTGKTSDSRTSSIGRKSTRWYFFRWLSHRLGRHALIFSASGISGLNTRKSFTAQERVAFPGIFVMIDRQIHLVILWLEPGS